MTLYFVPKSMDADIEKWPDCYIINDDIKFGPRGLRLNRETLTWGEYPPERKFNSFRDSIRQLKKITPGLIRINNNKILLTNNYYIFKRD